MPDAALSMASALFITLRSRRFKIGREPWLGIRRGSLFVGSYFSQLRRLLGNRHTLIGGHVAETLALVTWAAFERWHPPSWQCGNAQAPRHSDGRRPATCPAIKEFALGG